MSLSPESSDPVLVALAEYDRGMAALKAIDENYKGAALFVAEERVEETISRAENRMIETPAATIAGIIAKLSLALECLVPLWDDEPAFEVVAVRSAIADLERLSREAD